MSQGFYQVLIETFKNEVKNLWIRSFALQCGKSHFVLSPDKSSFQIKTNQEFSAIIN